MYAVKQPQDHLEKKTKPKVERVDITVGEDGNARQVPGQRVTIQDVTVEVADEAIDDFELLDDLRAVDVDHNASRLPALLHRLVGDGYRDVMEGIRDATTGRVSIARGAEFIRELVEALDPNS